MAELRRKRWIDVDGWLTHAEGRALQMLAAGRRVLELGSYKGRSTCCLAAVASHVISVDQHTGDRHTGPADTLADLIANLKACGADEDVTVFKATIAEFGRNLDQPVYGMVFVDCEHTYEATWQGMELALRAVEPGGVVAWHDADMIDVMGAAADSGLVAQGMVDRLAWSTRPS